MPPLNLTEEVPIRANAPLTSPLLANYGLDHLDFALLPELVLYILL